MKEPTLEDLIAERLRAAGEVERLKRRVAELSAQIDAHLKVPGQQQQQPQPPKAGSM